MEFTDRVTAAMVQLTTGSQNVTGSSLLSTDQVFSGYLDQEVNWAKVYLNALDEDATLVPFSIACTPLWNEGRPRSALAFMGVADRRRLAADPEIDRTYLAILAADPSRSVREAVSRNRSTPDDLRLGLRADSSDGWGPFAQPGRDWDPVPDTFYLGMEYWTRDAPGDLEKAIRLMEMADGAGHPEASGPLRAMREQQSTESRGQAPSLPTSAQARGQADPNELEFKTRANHFKRAKVAIGGHLFLRSGPDAALVFRAHPVFQRRYELAIPLDDIKSVTGGIGKGPVVERIDGTAESFVVPPHSALFEELNNRLKSRRQ